MRPVRIVDGAVVTRCDRGTFNGPAAEASTFGFARCILPAEHAPPCDAGPSDEPEPPQRAA